jgi:hypothetical protein
VGLFAVAGPAHGFSQNSRQFLLDSFDVPSSAWYAVINDEFAAASLLRLAPKRSIDIPWRDYQHVGSRRRQSHLERDPEISFVNRGRKGLHTIEADLESVRLKAMRQIHSDGPLPSALRSPRLRVPAMLAVDGAAAVGTNPELLELVATVRPEKFPLLAVFQGNTW